ncbi:MAG: 50S ribosomal protein L15 [Bradymonadales bacterium]|nr:50S ribosomal protein L15 [Bradymonadales bacterium]
MGLDTLKPASGSRQRKKRVGRGTGSGSGRTSGRGHKGQRSRSGGGNRRGFEGGQMPLHRRLPKRGFKNLFSKRIMTVNIKDLNRFEEGAEVWPEDFIRVGLIHTLGDGVKVLAYGELDRKLTVKANDFSEMAIQKIERAGGTAQKVSVDQTRAS